jgi:acetyl-CoA/propionyl-CoA carboxylase biotin carboxyl carrier protein
MQGTVIDVKVAVGDSVASGSVVCIVEAMKMENEVTAHRAGTVSGVSVSVGMPVTIGQAICAIDADRSLG